ncbi:MAG: hypothetical protein ACI8R9_001482 [Paraglaciecola sp.]|jgi:hypothetical protein
MDQSDRADPLAKTLDKSISKILGCVLIHIKIQRRFNKFNKFNVHHGKFSATTQQIDTGIIGIAAIVCLA